MDIEEWELVPDEGFLEIHDDGGKRIYSRKYPRASKPTIPTVIHTNYFICPSKPTTQHQQQQQELQNNPIRQLLPLTIHLLEPTIVERSPAHKEAQIPDEIKKSLEKIDSLGTDRDPVSQVFFKKMKETEFVDMKVGSPKSSSAASSGFIPQMEGAIQFQEKGEEGVPCGSKGRGANSEVVMKGNSSVDLDLDEDDEGGLNIWKWSLTGIGAICSFGVVFATVCGVIIFSSGHGKNQKIQLQIYTSDKRMNQGMDHGSRANEAISAVKGVPISKARITFGGRHNAAHHV